MRILVTGHQGYIGSVLVPQLLGAGHHVAGLDAGLFRACVFAPQGLAAVPEAERDVRDADARDLAGFDAVVHLANLSNDPLSDLDPALTYAINHEATVRLARLARLAGVGRFVFASSCSLYGAAGQDAVTERAPMRPVSPYGHAKALAERDLAALASDSFSPVFLRNATVYGASPRLRFDLVANNLTAWAVSTGTIRLLSDGTPWRPLVHVRDVGAAVAAVLDAPREAVHNEAFNVGVDGENLRVRDVAALVAEAVPGCRVEFVEGAGPDLRSYRVSFAKIAERVPAWRPQWTVREGVREVRDALAERALAGRGLTPEVFEGPAFSRIAHLRALMDEGAVGPDLRFGEGRREAAGRPERAPHAV